ncbi:MAG: hypothetical protein R3D35_16045 [Nitratireductor sp.]
MAEFVASAEELEEHVRQSLTEMREHGMCFHEGYLLGVSENALRQEIDRLAAEVQSFAIRSTIVDEHGRQVHGSGGETMPDGCSHLHAVYSSEVEGECFHYQLLADRSSKEENPFELEIVCDRTGIVGSSDPVASMFHSFSEFYRLYEVLEATVLFVGPDCNEAPEIGVENKYWLRVI